MSEVLHNEFIMDFVKLLLRTSKIQAHALLYTATPEQLNFLCEILHNLQQGIFPSSKQVKLILHQNRRLLKSFHTAPPKSKRSSLIRKHLRYIYKILIGLKKYLLQL